MNRSLVCLLALALALASSVVCHRTARAQEERTPRVYDLPPPLRTSSDDSELGAHGSLMVEQREANEPAYSRVEVRSPALEIADGSSIAPELLADVVGSCLAALFDREQAELMLRTSGATLRATLTEKEHQATLHVLDHVWSATGALLEVECLLVAPEAWAELTRSTRFEGEGRNAIFERALLDPRSRFLSVACRNGERGASGPLTRHRVLDDFAVNQTGVMPVLDPVVHDRWAGERLEVVPLVLRRSGSVFVDLAIARYVVSPQNTSHEGPWAGLEAPVQEELLLSTSLIVKGGQAVLAGELSVPGEGLIALVRVNSAAGAPAAPAPQVGERLLRVHETAPLFRIRRRTLEDAEDRDSWNDEDFANRLADQFGDSPPGIFALRRLGDDLAVVATEEVHLWITSMIDEELTRMSRNVRIELEVLTVPRAVYAELRRHRDGSRLLADDWNTALAGKVDVQRERYRVTGAAGQVHGFRDVEWEPFLVGVDQVSGGTGFANIEVADPVFADGGSGTQIRLEAMLASDGHNAHLRFEGERASILEKRVVSTVYPVLTAVTASKGEPAPAAVGQNVGLTLPQQESLRWDIVRQLPLGRWGILYSDAKAGEGVQLVVARVTAGEG